eukprot:GSChrysophyteH1.ASY1.ANO1.2437.1 assembled CDS
MAAVSSVFSASGASTGLACQIGSDTDIGGGRENQDDFFVFSSDGVIIMCVLDGHGREVGKCAANTARSKLIDYFKGVSFRAKLEQQGLEVQEAEGGYLRKRRPGDGVWSCVHGGSSCSIVTILRNKCYIANVGDSTGILCGYRKCFTQPMVVPIGDSSKAGLLPLAEAEAAFTVGALAASSAARLAASGDTVVLTADHSPECPNEFKRLRNFRPSEEDSRYPALKVVYDSPSGDKTCCPQVFHLDNSQEPHVSNQGQYYKNVRKEWASLVSTPSRAAHQDALAFTRSLGDLHLHTYGVTHEPEVRCIDLNLIWSTQTAAASEHAAKDIFCIVLATDGVWDNWLYEDVTRFVMDASCVAAVLQAPDGAQRVAQSFMQRNAVYAKRNFGSQADNATGIVGYFSASQAFTPLIINSV